MPHCGTNEGYSIILLRLARLCVRKTFQEVFLPPITLDGIIYIDTGPSTRNGVIVNFSPFSLRLPEPLDSDNDVLSLQQQKSGAILPFSVRDGVHLPQSDMEKELI